ncbi:MAG: S8/S53 family peptidase [Saprospiraceae bacterium]|nr:S8/S53 family peptidase [Saprospiraceae bacterium]
MNTTLLILLAVVVALALLLYFWRQIDYWLYNPRPIPPGDSGQNGYKTITLADGTTEEVHFVPNQLIYMPNRKEKKFNQKKMLKFLDFHGFKPLSFCPCNDQLMIYQGEGIAHLVSRDPPPDPVNGNKIGGLSLNYLVEPVIISELTQQLEDNSPGLQDNSIEPIIIDGLESTKESDPIKNRYPVTIGVSDSGVDLHPNGPLIKFGYLWNKSSMLTGGSCLDPGENGLSKLTPNIQPIDKDGHGTFINGILGGGAMSDNKTQKEITDKVKLCLFNIKNSDADTFLIVDAMCGLYFAAEQGIRLFNISWGYLEEESAGSPSIFTDFLDKYPDAILVAGIGNKGNGSAKKGISLDGNARFWPACLAENHPRVISVGALNENWTEIADFSNYSSNPDRLTVLAPGENIISLAPKSLQREYLKEAAHKNSDGKRKVAAEPSGYTIGCGTSYATPFVTREIAVMLAEGTKAADIKSKLQSKLKKISDIPKLEI